MVVNNSTDINKMNNHILPQIIEHHKLYCIENSGSGIWDMRTNVLPTYMMGYQKDYYMVWCNKTNTIVAFLDIPLCRHAVFNDSENGILAKDEEVRKFERIRLERGAEKMFHQNMLHHILRESCIISDNSMIFKRYTM